MSSLDDRSIYDDRPRSRQRETSEYGRGLAEDRGADREISLGTGTILGIFFGLALVCAVFFGLGYSMGRKSAQPVIVAADGAVSGGVFNSFKPAPGSPAAQTVHPSDKSTALPVEPQANSPETQSPTPSPAQSAPQVKRNQPENAPSTNSQDASDSRPEAGPVRIPAQAATAYSAPSAAGNAASIAMPATSASGTIMVQIAAVSHQEDADVLLSALKQRGYAVIVRQEAQDRLMHVQVGPFATRKDADLMRQRLLADGYNAIVK